MGRLLREHNDIDYLTLNLHRLKSRIAEILSEHGWQTKDLENGDLSLKKENVKVHLGNVEIGDVARWTHNGERGALLFPVSWLSIETIEFYGMEVHVVAPELQYVLKECPELLNPDWILREKDTLEKEHLRQILLKKEIDICSLQELVSSMQPARYGRVLLGETLIEIIACQDRFEELVSFVARLNRDGTHHIGFFGESESDIRSSLAECLILPAEGFMMAYDGEQLAGIFGVDADPEIDRAWLFGPLVDHADWHDIADKLYAKVLSLISVDIRDYDLFCDVRNVNMESFAARHGFPLTSENAVLTLLRDKYNPSARRRSRIIAYDERFFHQLEKLHKALFPNAYFTTQQMAEKVNEIHRLFLAVEENQLLGFHFCKIEPESESGYIDFIGTDSSARGRGIGADLLASGVDWMLSAPTTRKINLTVNADNTAARHLYENFGFVTERVMRGYRKRIV
jgi:ribosomal protein S18 acetylase RimI-like enzyme